MNGLSLALADLRHRRLAHLLHLLLLALGVAMVVALIGLSAQIERRFDQDGRGVDAVIGAKGSPLQLILSTVYHLDIPTGNIPLAEAEALSRNPTVAEAIPLSLGDNARGYRIIGTTPALIAQHQAQFASGVVWNAPMEAVIGAEVARAGLKLGDHFVGMHGLGSSGHAHADHAYQVVGVLAPTGGVLDRLILTSLDSVWALHAPHHHADEHEDHDDDDDHAAAPPREITALLIRYRSPLAAAGFPRMVNTQTRLQAAVPALETARLLNLLGVGLDMLRGVALLLIAASGLSVFVAVVQSMESRQYDLAVLRCLGAGRRDVVWLLWLSAVLLCCVGTLLGWGLGHTAVALLAAMRGPAQGVGLSGASFESAELWLLAVPPLLATLAVAIPAWRAYRTDITTLLARP